MRGGGGVCYSFLLLFQLVLGKGGNWDIVLSPAPVAILAMSQ